MLRSWMNTVPAVVWLRTVLTLFVLALSAGTVANAIESLIPETWRNDADLRDVQFVDAAYGWAVGDHGTIWHTQNGGEIWRQQKSKVNCQLSSVHFVSRTHGWAAGGEVVPLTKTSKGILLRTIDGGENWKRVDGLLLPWLLGIHFSDEKSGFAIGHYSSLYPTGAWSTKDGGRTWSPLGGTRGNHWVTHDLQQNVGLLVGHNGRIARITKDRIATVGQNNDFWTRDSFTAMVDSKIYFAGQTTPTLSIDNGKTWQRLGAFQPEGVEKRMQLRTQECMEGSSWLAGAPGNRILYSHDYGQNWQSVVAPSTLPLEKLFFSSANDGWAVGARGTILSTKDGGQSWKLQRGGMKRYALLGVFADERDIPWEVIASAAAVDEYRVHIVLLTTADRSDRQGAMLQYLQDAAMNVGATAEILTRAPTNAEIQLPVPQQIQQWNTLRTDSVDWISEQLTRIIRARTPDIVLTSEFGAAGEKTSSQRLVGQIASDACEYAANEKVFPRHARDFGLGVWSVKRALKCVAKQGPVAVSNRSTATGSSSEELAAQSRETICIPSTKQSWALQSMLSAVNTADVGSKPFAGLAVAYDSAARRPRLADRQSNSNLRLTMALSRNKNKGSQRVEQIERFANGDTRLAGRLLFLLAEEEADLSEREQLLRHFVERYDSHPLLDAALTKLVRFHTSMESQWRAYRSDQKHVSNVQLASVPSSYYAPKPALLDQAVPVKQAAATEPTFAANWKPAFQLLQQLKSKRPALYAEPGIAFSLAAVKRLGQPDGANSLLQSHKRLANQWRQFAQLELGLVGTANQVFDEARVWPCKTMKDRPHLDGEFSDAIWQSAEFKQLKRLPHEDNPSPTMISFAKDDKFLYLAAYCPKRPAVQYFSARKKRPRDAELNANDRIELRFDVNRDYGSWWSLSMDHRGWTHDALNDDASWNPKYYVAANSNEEAWTLEVAFPLAELAPKELRSSSYWALDVKRVVPHLQVERWNPTKNGGQSTRPAGGSAPRVVALVSSRAEDAILIS